MGPEEEFELHNKQNSWPLLFEVRQKNTGLRRRFTDISLTNQLADSQLADKTTRWQTNSLTLDLPVILMNSVL